MQLVDMSRDADGDNPMPGSICIYLDQEALELLGVTLEVGTVVRVEALALVCHKQESYAEGEDENRQNVCLEFRKMAVSEPVRGGLAGMYPTMKG